MCRAKQLVCMCVCVCIVISLNTDIYKAKLLIYIYMYMYMNIYIYAKQVWFLQEGVYECYAKHMHINMHVCLTHVHVYFMCTKESFGLFRKGFFAQLISSCICIYIYIYKYTYMCIYTHIYTYIHICVYIHIYIYIYCTLAFQATVPQYKSYFCPKPNQA